MSLLANLIGNTDLEVNATFKSLNGDTLHEHRICHNMNRHEACAEMKRYIICAYANSIKLDCPIHVKVTCLKNN